MKVLLHIGQSKTGSSAIQAFLTLNRAALLDQGVLFPVFMQAGVPLNFPNHNPLADALVGVRRFPYLTDAQCFSQFFAQAQRTGRSNMILSAEHFFGGEPRIWDITAEHEYWDRYRRKVQALAGSLHGHELHVLVYLRDQVSWLASAIAQTIRSEGLVSTKRIYRSDRQFFGAARPVLSYASLLDIWYDVLKPSKLEIVPYDRKALYGGSSISDFLHRAGIDGSLLKVGTTSMSVNTSLTREYLEVKKRLNDAPRSKTTERVIINILERLSQTSRQPTTYDLDPAVREEVIAFAREENQRLARNYGVELKLGNEDARHAALTAADINAAMKRFDDEYRRPKYRLTHLKFGAKAIARLYARPLHALLHQAKHAYRHRIMRAEG